MAEACRLAIPKCPPGERAGGHGTSAYDRGPLRRCVAQRIPSWRARLAVPSWQLARGVTQAPAGVVAMQSSPCRLGDPIGVRHGVVSMRFEGGTRSSSASLSRARLVEPGVLHIELRDERPEFHCCPSAGGKGGVFSIAAERPRASHRKAQRGLSGPSKDSSNRGGKGETGPAFLTPERDGRSSP